MLVNSRRSAHAADTRRALVAAARRLFSRQGYAATSLDEVCDRARVTKGALYHHFRNKEDLFSAVLEDVEGEFVRAGAAAVAPGADVWESLRSAGTGFLDVCTRGDTRRIVSEAPAVLGWERCRALEDRHALGLLRASLAQAVERGELVSATPDVLAQLLVALFNEAGMIVAGSDATDRARQRVGQELDRILAGLRAVAPSSRSPGGHPPPPDGT